ncbi:hypothetical protein G9A89_005074 [Geosiphon pyriformis]|nr:hypothetical protein G9A89_005074 [Geosiphon pyriformis]
MKPNTQTIRARNQAYAGNVHKRGFVRPSLRKEVTNKYPLGYFALGVVVFVVVGSAFFELFLLASLYCCPTAPSFHIPSRQLHSHTSLTSPSPPLTPPVLPLENFISYFSLSITEQNLSSLPNFSLKRFTKYESRQNRCFTIFFTPQGGQGHYDDGYGNQYNQNGYGAPTQGGGNQYSRQQPVNPYNQQQQPQYSGRINPGFPQQDVELSNLNQNSSNVNSFFEEVSSIQDAIRKMQSNISAIEELHGRSLGTISEDASTKDQLDALTTETRNLGQQVKNRIRKIEAMNAQLPPSSGDLNVRKAQAANLRKKFLETLQNYQQMEYQNRQKYRQRMERQYKIVKPNASEEEIEAALDNDEGGQIFAQSLLQSTRYGAAREALREVQERHDEIKKIEKTIEELANLFSEMSMLVEAQETQIESIEQHAVQITTDLEQGVVHVEQALTSAKSARRKKWWCLLIFIIILIIAAGAIYWFVIRKN